MTAEINVFAVSVFFCVEVVAARNTELRGGCPTRQSPASVNPSAWGAKPLSDPIYD